MNNLAFNEFLKDGNKIMQELKQHMLDNAKNEEEEEEARRLTA